MVSQYLAPGGIKAPTSNERLSRPTLSNKNSFIRPVPSISCTSAFSVQTFHTAIENYDDDHNNKEIEEAEDEEEDRSYSAKRENRYKQSLASKRCITQEEPSSSKTTNTFPSQNSYYKYQKPPNLISRSSSETSSDIVQPNHHPLEQPTTNSSSMMIHPMALVHSHTSNSIASNFFYYGSLDSGMLSKSPAGSYFHDYYSEDYEVVLDDGTRQKRSVSLSTMPIVTPMEYGSSKKKYKGNYNHSYYLNGEDDLNRNMKINQASE